MKGTTTLLRVAWMTLRGRLPGFAGAIVALALGVGYSGAAVSVLATGAALPAGTPLSVRQAAQESGSLLVMLAVIGAFVTIHVVAGTFAFVVAQRRRELALLRAVGATPRQVRGMVIAEAWLAALLASAVGIVLAFPLTGVMTSLLRWQRLLPAGFESRVSLGALAGAFAAGVVIGVLAAAASAGRAARVRPAEALRDSALADRPIGRGRWLGALAFLACGGGMLALVPVAPPDGRMPLTMFVSLPLVLGFTLLAPAFAGWAGAAVATPLVRVTSATGLLARENVRQAVRRTASTAAPVLVTVGLTGSLLGGTALLGQAIAADFRQAWRSDLVVSGPGAAEVGTVRGVVAAVRVTRGEVVVAANRTERRVDAFGVRPEGLERVMNLSNVAGDLAGLRYDGAAADRRQAETFGWRLGGPVRLTLPGGKPAVLRLTAVFDGSPFGGTLLLPRDFLPGPVSVHVAVAPEAAAGTVAAAIERRWTGIHAASTAESASAASGARLGGMRIGALALAAFAVAYTLIAVANTSVMAFGARGAEFARLLRLGARRVQVLRMVLWESLSVSAIGVLLGGAVTAVAVLGLREVLRGLGVTVVPDLPWAQIGSVACACVAVVTLSGLMPAALLVRRQGPSSRR
ncbi:ABC transporter permease [Microbispora hainanensis]|uniref:FtsX-like permease family protein n=1 Tax=Microbispora hainanensis TaxID=568844 RepID=A0A544Z2P2_9ACTN|nr:ABC transporter permease [Microbispora hainanensis]TQS23317.1 FtsX-like permease family protein [Microbispora hainanensis]